MKPRWGAFVLVLAAALPAEGYRLFTRGVWVPTSEEAARWPEFPLRFRMLENDNLPAGIEITQREWEEIVERGFDHWNRIPTARITVGLEPESVPRDAADEGDDINTVGFSSNELFVDSWITATARWRFDGDRLVGCDIEVSPDFVKNWNPQDPARLLEIVIAHEMGHCLGLAHSEPHPMPLWTGLPVTSEPAFLPDPVMSYSNSYGLELSEDDRVAVSLLYPAPGFWETRGSVRGRVEIEGASAPYAYVQAVRPGGREARAGPGPGTFADEDGAFLLEGLLPGDWMLWVHPILVTRRNAHGFRRSRAEEAGAHAFRDRLRWVVVRSGEVTDGVTVRVERGRQAAE